jgi:hypothetical protein
MFEASLTDNARVIIYDRHMFIVKTTGLLVRLGLGLGKRQRLGLGLHL